MSTPSGPNARTRLALALAAAAAAAGAPSGAAAAPRERGESARQETVAYHPDAVSDLELTRLSTSGASPRLAVLASHPGLLHVEWRAGGHRGVVRQPVRAGHAEVALRGVPVVSHLRLRATLIPDGDYASSGATGAFKLRSR